MRYQVSSERVKLYWIYNLDSISGGPPSDISDRSANSDKVGPGEKGAVVKKESTGKE